MKKNIKNGNGWIKWLLVVFGFTFLLSVIITEMTTSKETEVIKSITVSQFIEMKKQATKNYIYVGRPTCGYCVQSEPWTKKIAANAKITVYYVNIDNETTSSLSTLATATDGLYDGSTPLFLVMENNKILGSKIGAGSYEDLNAFFQGFIK